MDEGKDGDFVLTAGKWFGGDSEADAAGIQTGPDARFFASSAELPASFDNAGKDLVLQVTPPFRICSSTVLHSDA